jgi:hypothetical protein
MEAGSYRSQQREENRRKRDGTVRIAFMRKLRSINEEAQSRSGDRAATSF